jgi:hypothetical protein
MKAISTTGSRSHIVVCSSGYPYLIPRIGSVKYYASQPWPLPFTILKA